MIKTYRDRETEKIGNDQRSKRLPARLHRIAARKLAMLDTATQLRDLRRPPGNRLEKLSGRRANQHSIRINDQFRVCFRWVDGDAYDVEITDYH